MISHNPMQHKNLSNSNFLGNVQHTEHFQCKSGDDPPPSIGKPTVCFYAFFIIIIIFKQFD